MKDFFKSKTNIILLTVLIILIVIAGFLAYSMFGPQDVLAINFSNLTENEVIEWKQSNDLSDEMVKIRYEYSEEVEEGQVSYQSVKEGESISGGITIVISLGYNPDLEVALPSIDNMTKATMKEWLDENKFSNYSFEYVLDEENEIDKVIKLNVEGKAKRSDEIIVTISAGNDIDNVVITVPDFSTYTKAQIDEWADNNRINVKYNYVISSAYPEGKIIEQSIEAESEMRVGDSITITISQGNGLSMPDFYNSSRSSVDNWSKENNIKVNYYYVESATIKENYVVSTDPKAGILIGSGNTVKVYLSSGQAEEEVTVADDKLNSTEASFIEYIKSLGLNVNKSNVTYFSTTIAKGNIYSYDDGSFKKGDTINYSLSEGPYAFNSTDYNGKSKSQAQSVATSYNNRNAHINISFKDVETSDYDNGITFACQASSSGINVSVTCNVAINEAQESPEPSPSEPPAIEYVNVPNYVGQSSPCSSNAASCAIDSITYNISYETSDTYEAGIVIRQDKKGNQPVNSTVSLVVSSGIRTSFIGLCDLYAANSAMGEGYAEALDRVTRNLGVFDLTIETISDPNLSDGQIASISVGDYGTSYNPGQYPVNTKVVVIIVKKG